MVEQCNFAVQVMEQWNFAVQVMEQWSFVVQVMEQQITLYEMKRHFKEKYVYHMHECATPFPLCTVSLLVQHRPYFVLNPSIRNCLELSVTICVVVVVVVVVFVLLLLLLLLSNFVDHFI